MKLFCNISQLTAHECSAQTIHSSPAVRKHFDSYFLPNELVSVSHLEAKSLAQATQSAGAVAPGHSYTKMVTLQQINNAYIINKVFYLIKGSMKYLYTSTVS